MAARRARPAPRPARRTFGDVGAGIAAIIVLLVLTIGVPVALVAVIGAPLPHATPVLSLLTRRLDIFTILRICSVVVWLAWLQLVFCVVAEVRAAVRNSGMPARVPFAGGMQAAVHRLVTTALLAFTAATALTPALAHASPPRVATVVSSPVPSRVPVPSAAPARQLPVVSAQPGADHPGTQHPARAAPDTGPRLEKVYVVQPPVGRFHESLWEIAQTHLGDGRRYHEIFALNKDRVQPDGSRLTIASLIRPGWVLRMPRDAHGPGIDVVPVSDHAPGQQARAGHRPPAHDSDGASAHAASPPAAKPHTAAPQTPAPQTPAQTPAPRSAAPRSAAPRSAAPRSAAVPASPLHTAPAPAKPVYQYELAAAALLAAGVLSALGRRRREQLWRRAFGRRIALPAPEAARAEVALRLAATEAPARMLDSGLRYLGRELARLRRTPPTVFAAYLGEENLDLWISSPDPHAPPPWTAAGDGQVWRLPLAAVPALGNVAAEPSPYPGLVSIGTDASGRVLVDMSSARGVIAVTGPGAMVRAALTAMAVELVTSYWSGDVLVTLAGFGADVTLLDPERVTGVATLADALPALEVRAAKDDGPDTGIPAMRAPHYLISAVPPSEDERERLIALAHAGRDAAYVIAGDVAGATWTWEVTGDGRLRAGPLGFDVAAQLLPADQHAWVVDLFRAAAEPEGALLGSPPPDAAPAEQLAPESVWPVEVTLLGQTSVRAAGEIEPGRLGLATELVAYLAVHPGGVHPNVLAGALWPRGVTPEVRDAWLDRVAQWLGSDDIGRPHLATDAGGRLRLGSQVRVDWQVFCALLARAGQGATAGPAATGTAPVPPAEEESALAQALSLVQGPFMDGRQHGRFAWLASDGLEYEAAARVADAAHRLWELRLAADDPYGAMDAAHRGLRLAYDDERLWRDLLRAAHATRHEGLLRNSVEEVRARSALGDGYPRMTPETEALIDELWPNWRSSVA
jgi:hypothetical protein